jgi:pimeloyl-ACP methyl ester carboxylesterase
VTDPVTTFFKADTGGRIALLKEEGTADAIRAYLGDAAFQELKKLGSRVDRPADLAVKSPPNLVFIPGIMGSLLMSETKGGVWWIDARTRKHLDDLGLSADGAEDNDVNNQVRPFTVDTSYEAFALAALERDDFGHKNFAYDWRKSYFQNTEALRKMILEMHSKNNGQPVHIVAHSMGGIMARAALMKHGNDLWPIVGRIVFIGTPHYGSPSIAGYLKNHLWGWNLMAVLGMYLSRETFRSLWGVLHLLPAPLGVYPGTRPDDNPPWRPHSSDDLFYPHPCANFNMYDANAWKLGLSNSETAQLQRVLDAAAAFHHDLHEWHKQLNQEYRDRMLMVAGVGMKTLFRLAYRSGLGGLFKEMDKPIDRVPGDPHREGDGRVPLASARLRSITMRYVKGSHGGLTNIPAVYNDVFRWLKEEPLSSLPETVEAALSAHMGGTADRSEAPHLDGTAQTSGEDPGYWNFDEPDETVLRALDAEVERGAFPEFNRVRLL